MPDPDLIERLAREAGLVDPDLSKPGCMVTDYGRAEEAVRRFAALVAENCAKIADSHESAYPENEAIFVAAKIREQFCGGPPAPIPFGKEPT